VDAAATAPGESFRDWLAALRPAVEDALERILPPADAPPARLHAAMRYSVFAGGKRVRPALAVLAGESWGAPRTALLPPAAALELIHTYSLVHDDLPALDDDDLRRGRPTAHRQFDEATAILAGDALLTLGLTTLACEPPDMPPAVRRAAVELVGTAIGTTGMIGGQMADLEAEREWPLDAAAALETIHRGKTGALLTASVVLGGLLAGAPSPGIELLQGLGARLGLMFQIADDVLDVEGSAEELGKTAGKDAAHRKLTYPGLHGVAESRRRLVGLHGEARALVADLPGQRELWLGLLDYLVSRRA
jgi:geranylgeranyl diphosphate synthase type II